MTLLSPTVVSDDTRLGLRHVLPNTLPTNLDSADAPDRYTVDAVFTRRASRDEIALITGGVVRDALRAAGYPEVGIEIVDRRLRILNTSIPELQSGLASLLADQIADISDMTIDLRNDQAAAALRAADEQRVHAAAVVELAASVSFATSRP